MHRRHREEYQPYIFLPRVSKLTQKVVSPKGKEETTYAVMVDVPLFDFFSNGKILGKGDRQCVVIVPESEIDSLLEFVIAKDTIDEKYNALLWPSNSLGYLTFAIKEADDWNPVKHVYLQKRENLSRYKHVGYALDEYNLRIGLREGTEGRACNEASWTSHFFHWKCGFLPGQYHRRHKDKEAEFSGQMAAEEKKLKNGEIKTIDTTSMAAVPMFRPDEIIPARMQIYDIPSAEEALPDDNFLTIEQFLISRKLNPILDRYQVSGNMNDLLTELKKAQPELVKLMSPDLHEANNNFFTATKSLVNNPLWDQKGIGFWGTRLPTCIKNIREAKTLAEIVAIGSRLAIKSKGWGVRDAATTDLLLLLQVLNPTDGSPALDIRLALIIVNIMTHNGVLCRSPENVPEFYFKL
ncbi:MAG: hypothetical protein ACYCQI_15035 [Gammaproteobacteria bacterium]